MYHLSDSMMAASPMAVSDAGWFDAAPAAGRVQGSGSTQAPDRENELRSASGVLAGLLVAAPFWAALAWMLG